MQQSFQFQSLQNQFPQVNLWPGDRDGKTWPNSQSGPKGGLQFTIGYPLRNGCQTCAHAGFALFTWNFSSSGRFMGTTFLGMTPRPSLRPGRGTRSSSRVFRDSFDCPPGVGKQAKANRKNPAVRPAQPMRTTSLLIRAQFSASCRILFHACSTCRSSCWSGRRRSVK